MGIWDDIKGQFGTMGRMTNQLVIVNVAIFLVLGICGEFSKLLNNNLYTYYNDWLALNSNFKTILLRPWTVISHGFLHYDLLHVLFNMLWLYFFGRTLEEYIGKRKILPLYIYSVLFGAFLAVVSLNVFPVFSESKHILLGASAAVMGIVWATVTLVPEHRFNLIFLGPVKIIYIAAFMTVLDLLAVAGTNGGGAIAHLGGALMGFVYIKQLQVGNDFSKSFNRLWDGFLGLFQSRKKMKVSHRNPSVQQKRKQSKPKSTKRDYFKGSQPEDKPSQNEEDRQKELDSILDKISKGGYDSLSKAEKAFLFKVSNEKDS